MTEGGDDVTFHKVAGRSKSFGNVTSSPPLCHPAFVTLRARRLRTRNRSRSAEKRLASWTPNRVLARGRALRTLLSRADLGFSYGQGLPRAETGRISCQNAVSWPENARLRARRALAASRVRKTAAPSGSQTRKRPKSAAATREGASLERFAPIAHLSKRSVPFMRSRRVLTICWAFPNSTARGRMT